MITREECERKLETLLEQYSEVDEVNMDSIDIRESNLITDLGLNSFSLVQLIVDIEDEFGICFDDEKLDLEKFASFTQLVNVVYDEINRHLGD